MPEIYGPPYHHHTSCKHKLLDAKRNIYEKKDTSISVVLVGCYKGSSLPDIQYWAYLFDSSTAVSKNLFGKIKNSLRIEHQEVVCTVWQIFCAIGNCGWCSNFRLYCRNVLNIVTFSTFNINIFFSAQRKFININIRYVRRQL